jgi:hypothetical protein
MLPSHTLLGKRPPSTSAPVVVSKLSVGSGGHQSRQIASAQTRQPQSRI